MSRGGARVWCSLAQPLLVCALCGCWDNMEDQASNQSLEASVFFADGASVRPPIDGAVAWNDPIDPPAPPPVDMELLRLGMARFNGICAACHARDGFGEGVVVQRGFPAPPSLHEARLRELDDSHLISVITDGLGKMPSYSEQLDHRERYAVVAYIRALQLSQNAPSAVGDAGRGEEGSR